MIRNRLSFSSINVGTIVSIKENNFPFWSGDERHTGHDGGGGRIGEIDQQLAQPPLGGGVVLEAHVERAVAQRLWQALAAKKKKKKKKKEERNKRKRE